ncbi:MULTISPECIES: acetate--CoA ligase [Nitrosomonas]|uniref:Acetyl-coenzyme A synthetase n=1 Tax=Nitrosomonas europaea (strain ATCC 19718 / CIP 103999 / KCTC 2705 / NBRC 14298) TaxID=228410 RepID=ACSA_NITEU|nr:MULTISPECIES: acetate--CoA ligase [Nitrosomonas]Q82SI5.1 RecName: Full=Acetyl-coenzyme A synthetase; Short=AcCoA synthetase; Short=Acs; AltName: Full=Acetate--CoA ligase; AltName: Full=Acyl-activating enzyme [Nitrosomonas europaea ATCC 19718]KXK41306.1 MAG: acetyl-CoA synthetase [Nitrosomonas europaea]MBV6389195.1 Acetyl-coenzyme A synthetase [Nitrosomonas europaea]MEB2330806.1 acetate--CoA ligase [Nitrosomonas sp.]CAD86253.1 AMP-dependent synthetase and ligase [Nitrosomonas europaea ATCC 1
MATIESILHENRIFPPASEFVRNANLSGREAYETLRQEAEHDYTGFWAKLAQQYIAWHKPFTRVLNDANPPFYKWFDDGELNISWNCLDRHLATQADKTAIIFESDAGEVNHCSYRELHRQVCHFANGLKSLGIRQGDRVVIYMPMRIEAVVAMQACARIGAIHSVVFGGFSAKSVYERIIDAGASAVITADEQIRGGRYHPLKATVDEALAMGDTATVHSVIVFRHTGTGITWQPERDHWWHDLIAGQPDECEPAWINAEHPLFTLYTSGSTGKPKGVQHSSAGYLLGAVTSMQWVFDYHADDVFWCTADVGWVTGHSYVAYGPLAIGATQVIFEGTPTHPHAGRFWEIIQKHRITTFYTAPTAIRSLIKLGSDLPAKYDLSSLRLLGSVGEPINPEAWMWYYTVVGQSRCPVVDTWWQTETGCHMIAPAPGAISTKPGSCTLPLPGIDAAVVDETGHPVEQGKGGFLVIKRPFPSMLRTLWNDPERFRKTYFPTDIAGGRYYLAGDSAHRDQDGYFWIMGRVDDVLNVSGHRLGTMEIESALVAHPLVAEAAVVGKPHEIKGEVVVAFVTLREKLPDDQRAAEIAATLREWVASEIGAIARPEEIRFGENLPKTRSGKIMRRLLRALARGETITQDVSTLENPVILEQLSQTV